MWRFVKLKMDKEKFYLLINQSIMSSKKYKNKLKKTNFNGLSVMQQIKAARKASRDEEIRLHGKPLKISSIVSSKQKYNRKVAMNNLFPED